MNKRNIAIGTRLFFGILTLTALGVQLAHLGANNVLNPVNFFSYFTNLSNLFVSVIFIISALYLATHRQPSPWDDIVRGASVLYMLVTGIIYATLLTGVELGYLLPWVNIQLHFIMPAAVLLDWLYQPQKSKLTFKRTWLWLIFPIVYLVYTLVRGANVGWYPYPFLNPDNVGGYGGVAMFSVGILLAFLALVWFLMTVGNKLKRNI